jgi:hypothetical protein
VLGAIKNVTGILEEYAGERAGAYTYDARAAEALKFLVHFVGDMHMPLHLTGRERGGNGARVTFDGRHTSTLLLLWSRSLQRLIVVARQTCTRCGTAS